MTTIQKVLLTYAVLGVALWPLPLLNILHVESSAVVAFVAFFVAGGAALRQFEEGGAVERVLGQQESALLVPLSALTLSLLWTPNCDYVRGLLFFGLFPGITVVFAVMVAYALSGIAWRRKRLVLIVIGLAVTLLGVVYDLGFHPQFYTYNHVFGGVLGPIYDERLAVRPGLFYFRGLTLLWALAAYLVGERLRGRSRSARFLLGGVVLVIGTVYLFSARLGLNTPAWYLQQQLGARYQTEHFAIYYDSTVVEADEIAHLARDHEYRYAWLTDRMGAEGPDRIASYLYPDAGTKARLTGARHTSVAPVWLATPQIHLLQDAYTRSFGHELVHVFTRPFGLPVVHASWSVGLVEGIAVAFEPPSGRPTPREQVSVAALRDSALTKASLADDLAARFSPLGFWTGRGAVSYTTMGSFVQFLLDRYGPDRLRRVYAWANFEEVYGKPIETLAQEWQRWIGAVPVIARSAEALVSRRFARPSLFERRCPHYLPPFRRAFERGQEALEAGDTTRAEANFSSALQREPRFVEGHLALAQLRLARGRSQAVIRQLDTLDVTRPPAGVSLLLGDAYALRGRRDTARHRYRQTLDRLPLYAHQTQAQIALRMAVADRPDIIRILVSADSAGVQAVRLQRLSDQTPAVVSWQALRSMRAGHHAEAMRLWQRMPAEIDETLPTYLQQVVRRQRYLWTARSALRVGRYSDAVTQARAARAAFRAVGAFNLAALADDMAHKARWMLSSANPAGE